jgi:hypothetical protein
MATKTKPAPKKNAKKVTKPRTIKVVEGDAKDAKPAKTTKAAKSDKRLSAIDAAARVLASSAEPLNCKEMTDAMAAKGLWSTPGGKTPHATLYSAILREISTKGKESRFTKAERGKFTVAK